MAEASPPRKLSPAEERQRLLREIEHSRRQLAGDLSGLGQAVNVRERLYDAVRRHPAWWIGGGVFAGLLLARLARGRTAEKGTRAAAKRPLLFGLLGFAGRQILRLAEPALKGLAQREIERWTAARGASADPAATPRPVPKS